MPRPRSPAGSESWSYSAPVWSQGFIFKNDRVVLLVALDKSRQTEEHRYEDRFEAPDRVLVRRHNNTRASLLNLAAKRGIQANEVHFTVGPGGPRLLPLPVLLIEASGGRLIEPGVIRPLAHGPRGPCPTGTRPPRRLDDKPSRLSVHFDLVWELCLIEEKLREADAPRVADLHDAALDGHVPTP